LVLIMGTVHHGFISARTQKAFKAMLVWDGKAGKVGSEFGSS
jgi:hypothetical protein